MSGPQIDRANSSGDIWTPKPFIRAVEHKFGPLTVDLAATAENTCAPSYLTKQDDSLSPNRYWHRYDGLCWLNPPYADIEPWARKCAEQSQLGARILLLVPASVGAVWYWKWVAPYAKVHSIGRLVFDNCFDRRTGKLVRTPYPKDLILASYQYAAIDDSGTSLLHHWDWKAEISAGQ